MIKALAAPFYMHSMYIYITCAVFVWLFSYIWINEKWTQLKFQLYYNYHSGMKKLRCVGISFGTWHSTLSQHLNLQQTDTNFMLNQLIECKVMQTPVRTFRKTNRDLQVSSEFITKWQNSRKGRDLMTSHSRTITDHICQA